MRMSHIPWRQDQVIHLVREALSHDVQRAPRQLGSWFSNVCHARIVPIRGEHPVLNGASATSRGERPFQIERGDGNPFPSTCVASARLVAGDRW